MGETNPPRGKANIVLGGLKIDTAICDTRVLKIHIPCSVRLSG